jgi:gliding motility-associated-like protein
MKGHLRLRSPTCLAFALQFVIVIANCQPGTWLWAESDQPQNGACVVFGSASDRQGSIYTVGYFTGGQVKFGSETLFSSGGIDIFIVKYGSNGTLLWARKFGGGGTDKAMSVAVDDGGNVYVTGSFGIEIKLGDTQFFSTPQTFLTYPDYFLMKLDPTGKVLWARRGVGGQDDTGEALICDKAGNVFVRGTFNSTSFVIEGNQMTGSTSGNAFVAKYNGHGDLIWAKAFKNAFMTWPYNGAIALGGDDKLYIAGAYMHEGFYADDIFLPAPAPMQSDIFLISLDTNGKVHWARNFGGSLAENCHSIALDPSGMIYITGTFASPILWLDEFSIVNKSVASPGMGIPGNGQFFTDAFVAKLSPSGKVKWVNTISGQFSDWAVDIQPDRLGRVFVTGSIFNFPSWLITDPSTKVQFGNLQVTAPQRGEYTFLTQYDTSGHVIFADLLSGVGWSRGMSLSEDPEGAIYLAGQAGTSIEFDDQVKISGTYFLAKLAPCNVPLVKIASPVALCPGETVTLRSESTTNNTWSTGETTQAISVKEPGRYSVFALDNENCVVWLTSTVVFSEPLPDAVIESDTDYLCPGKKATITSAPAAGYKWSTGSTESRIEVASGGDYFVTVTSANGCSKTSNAVSIESIPLPPTLTLIEDCSQILVDPELPVTWYHYGELFAGDTTEITPVDPGLYMAVLENVCGISKSDAFNFTPFDPERVFIPNIITPNGDSFNEQFVIDKKLKDAEIIVVNRWGGDVYRAHPYDNSWSGEGVPSGVYYYTIQHQCLANPLKGTLTIQR